MRGLGLGRGFSGNLPGGTATTPVVYLPTPFAQWNPNDATSLTQAGNLVSQQNDQTANGNTLTAVGAAQPSINTRTINGKNVEQFNGTTNMFTIASAIYAMGAMQNYLAMFVVASDSAVLLQRLFSLATGSTRAQLQINGVSSTIEGFHSTSATVASILAALDTGPHLVEMRRRGLLMWISLDGLDSPAQVAGDVSVSVAKLGGNAISSSSPFKGAFGYGRIYNTDLTNAQVQAARAELRAAYGTPDVFPAARDGFLWLDASQPSAVVNTANAVSKFKSRCGLGVRDLVQATSANQPTYNSAAATVTFDGVNDYLTFADSPMALLTNTALPDFTVNGTVVSAAGKGLGPTGFTQDNEDLTKFWVTYFGYKDTTDDGNQVNLNPGLVRLDSTRTVNEFEIVLKDTDPTIGSIQGVTIDTTKNYLAVASVDNNKVYILTKTGTLVASFAGPTGLNGLVYNPLTNQFILSKTDGTLYFYNIDYTTNTFTENVAQRKSTGVALVDQLFLDPTWNLLYMSGGPNGSLGQVSTVDLTNGYVYSYVQCTSGTAIEGMSIKNDTLTIANDGYFHGGGTNTTMTYDIARRVTAGLDLFVKFQQTASQAGEAFIFTSGTLASQGFALSIPAGSTSQIKMTYNDGVTNATATVTCGTALTTMSTIECVVDFAARTCSVYQGNVLQGTAAFSASTVPYCVFRNTSVGSKADGSGFLGMTLKQLYAGKAILSATDRLKAYTLFSAL